MQRASLTSFPPQSLTWSRFSTYKVQCVCFAYICNIFMCRYLKFWSIETIVKLKIQNCSTSSNEVHSWSIKDYEIAELFFRTGGVKSHLRCDCHVFRYLQPFCVTKSETCQMHLLQLLRKLTYCRDRSSSRYPCYSSRKPPGEGGHVILQHNLLDTEFKMELFWNRHFLEKSSLVHIWIVEAPLPCTAWYWNHFFPKPNISYRNRDKLWRFWHKLFFETKFLSFLPRLLSNWFLKRYFFFSDWKSLQADMSHSAIGKVAFNSLLIQCWKSQNIFKELKELLTWKYLEICILKYLERV